MTDFEKKLIAEKEENESKFKGVSFSSLVPKYAYDKDTDSLKIIGKIDTYEEIQSNKDCAIDRILNKFLDLGGDENQFFNVVADITVPVQDAPDISLKDDLELLMKSKASLGELRNKYGVSDNVSDVEFMKFLNIKLQEVSNLIKNKSEVKDEKIQIKEVEK